MKHLKKFNESSSERMTTEEINTMLDTIEDIFLDIKDDGFRLDYSGPILKLTITKPKQTVLGDMGVTFKLGDISNVVHHLYNYLITIDKLQFNKISMVQIGSNRLSSGRSIGMTNYIKIDELEKSSDVDINELTIKFDESFLKHTKDDNVWLCDRTNESKESKDIDLYVADIFRDLEDNGFNVFVKYRATEETLPYRPNSNRYSRLNEEVLVEICNSKRKFRYNDISKSVEHLKSFMKGEGYQLGGYTVNHNVDPKKPAILMCPYSEPENPNRFPEGVDGYYYHKINFIKIH